MEWSSNNGLSHTPFCNQMRQMCTHQLWSSPLNYTGIRLLLLSYIADIFVVTLLFDYTAVEADCPLPTVRCDHVLRRRSDPVRRCIQPCSRLLFFDGRRDVNLFFLFNYAANILENAQGCASSSFAAFLVWLHF